MVTNSDCKQIEREVAVHRGERGCIVNATVYSLVVTGLMMRQDQVEVGRTSARRPDDGADPWDWS
jgi:hypothetical protein